MLLHSFRLISCLGFAFTWCFVFASWAYAQGAGVGVGSSRPQHEGSRQPLKVKLSGFINTKPEEGSLGLIKLGIGAFRETYLFDLTNVEAVDRERVTPRAVLETTEERDVAFDLVGPRALLSKIAQAQPGTPLAITGFIQQRERRMQVTDVQVIGFESGDVSVGD